MAYFLLAIMATTIGAIAGIGGGVIIKPLLDLLGKYDVQTISFMSSMTVLAMAIVSSIRYRKSNVKIKFKQTIYIGIGSMLGGFLGERILRFFIDNVIAEKIIFVQNVILIVMMIASYYYMNNKEKFKSYNMNKKLGCIMVGLLLGTVSSVLSIGGGPINVCILAYVFSMDTKEAAINSIVVILLSQLSKLGTIVITKSIPEFDFFILIMMIVGGILGGILGSNLNKKFTEKKILLVFNTTLFFLISINLINIYNSISI